MLTLHQAGLERAPFLHPLEDQITPGELLAIVGPNGAGKSTLLSLLSGFRPCERGYICLDGKPLTQWRIEALAGRRALVAQQEIPGFAWQVEELVSLGSSPGAALLAELLDDLDLIHLAGRSVLSLSGGERQRVMIARGACQLLSRHTQFTNDGGLLLLDEPTNHLDLEMREALTEALASFEGTVILVSHDRHLLRASVDEFWRVADHRVEPFDGDLDDYRQWLKERLESQRRDARSDKSERQDQQPSADSREARKAARKAAAEMREKLRPIKKVRDQAEKAMEKEQNALTALEDRLADPALYTDASRKAELTNALAKQADIKARLDDAEQRWLAAEEELETAEAELLEAERG